MRVRGKETLRGITVRARSVYVRGGMRGVAAIRRSRGLVIAVLAVLVAGSTGCAAETGASGASGQVTVTVTGTPSPQAAGTPVPAPLPSAVSPVQRTGSRGSSSPPPSSPPPASTTPSPSPVITVSPIILGTGGYGCPGPGLPYPNFPSAASVYANWLYEAWTAGNKEGICELVILSGTDPLMAGVHTSSDNYVPTFPFCQQGSTYSECTFYGSTLNATLYMKILNSSLGGPHAVLEVRFYQGHYP